MADEQNLPNAEEKKLRSFADVQQTLVTDDVDLESLVDENAVAYYYRHRTTRDFRFGKWHFRDFMMTIRSEEENQRWIDDYVDMPSDEQTQIYEYHPEAAARVETPVGAATVRGPLGTTHIKDPKILSQAKPN